MKKRIKFYSPIDVTDQDFDVWEISFPFTVVDSTLIGIEAKKREEIYHRLIIKISGPQRASWKRKWKLNKDEEARIDWIKIIFQYVRNYFEEKIRTQSLQTDEVIDLSNAKPPQYEPSELIDPSGLEIWVEEEKPKIGFH